MKNSFAVQVASLLFFVVPMCATGVGQEIVYPATEVPLAPAATPGQPIQFEVPIGNLGNGQLREQFSGRLGQGQAGRGRRSGRVGRLGQRIQERIGEQLGNGGPIDLNQPRAQLLIQGLDYLLGPGMDVGANADGSAISVEIHPEAMTAAAEGFRQNVVNSVAASSVPADYGLTIYPEAADSENSAKRLVVVTHGFNSSPQRLAHVIQSLRDAKYRVATYAYATESGVVAAAQSLSTHLNGWTSRNPDYEVTLLAHSMGGIVSRYLVESPELHCAAIDQLIMVAPPNHGSELARIGTANQPLINRANQNQANSAGARPQILQLISRFANQVNPAIGDMRPDSEVLKVINDSPRNEEVAYTILLGNKAPLSQKQAVILAEVISELGAERPVIERVGQQAADTLDQVSEEMVGKGGDGVVSVTSGRLAGVDDIEVLKFQHNDLLNPQSDGWQLLEPAILNRLAKWNGAVETTEERPEFLPTKEPSAETQP